MTKVAIIGGSIGGLSAALTLASAINNERKFEISVIERDFKKSDLNKVAVYNVPLFPKGIIGEQIIEKTKAQIEDLAPGAVKFINGEVKEISGKKGDFKLSGDFGEISADYVIAAIGANGSEIPALKKALIPHNLMPKPGKLALKTSGRDEIEPGLYAAGIAAGGTTMVAVAMGAGAAAACAILSDLAGAITVLHDTPATRK